ncbi:MAG: family transcriptional regulator, regulator of sulfur utilization [Chloroflexota bacterium]|nr:family transcriptional regulator, regulator of sulfur utilization [Chloroflexota bacterium]
MDQINENISRNLRDLRKEKGLTLDELADLTGVSKSMLGEIERGGTNPTILTLWKIADGLKIPLTSLISTHQPDYTLVRGDRLEALSRTDAYEIFSVFPYYGAHKNEILHLKIAPRGRLSNAGHLNGVDEVIYVIAGAVRMLLDREEIFLRTGDAIRFKGELAHEFNNEGDQDALLLNVLNYSHY